MRLAVTGVEVRERMLAGGTLHELRRDPGRGLIRQVWICFMALAVLGMPAVQAAEIKLLHVSYDATRDAFNELNQAFAHHYKQLSGDDVAVTQINGGAAEQARRVAAGMPADIVTLASLHDIEYIREHSERVAADWQQALPNGAQPFSSPVVFLVRAGNPRGIRDWEDLLQEGVQIVTSNPLMSGFGRYNYFGIYAWAARRYQNDEAAIRRTLEDFYTRVVVMAQSSGEAYSEFVLKNRGEVLLTWENVASDAVEQFGAEHYTMVIPSLTPLADPRVAVVSDPARRRGSIKAAEAYARYMFSTEGQQILARHHLRPALPELAEAYASHFSPIEPVTIGEYEAIRRYRHKHFHDGGWFKQFKLRTQSGSEAPGGGAVDAVQR